MICLGGRGFSYRKLVVQAPSFQKSGLLTNTPRSKHCKLALGLVRLGCHGRRRSGLSEERVEQEKGGKSGVNSER